VQHAAYTRIGTAKFNHKFNQQRMPLQTTARNTLCAEGIT
jgi:hypothetical protein